MTPAAKPGERCDDMLLPTGATCGQCAYHRHCVALFGCPATNTRCDWSPSRFAWTRHGTGQAAPREGGEDAAKDV